MQRNKANSIVPFHSILTTALVSGAASLQVYAGLQPRIGQMADCWKLYRYKRLRFRLLPLSFSSAADCVIAAYSQSVTDTSPLTFGNINDFLFQCSVTGTMTQPANWVTIPRSTLQGPMEWYWAVVGTAVPVEEIQGTFFFAALSGTGTPTIVLEIEGEIEFSGPVDPGSTPQERVRAHMAAEKLRIARALAYTDGNEDPRTVASRKLPPQTRP